MALFRNSLELTPCEIQGLVEAYGSENWQVGPELLKFRHGKATEILDKADARRKQK